MGICRPPPMSCILTGWSKPSQKTKNESVTLVAAVVSTDEPTPMSGTAIIVSTPAGIHAAADAAAHGVSSSGPCRKRTIPHTRPRMHTHADR